MGFNTCSVHNKVLGRMQNPANLHKLTMEHVVYHYHHHHHHYCYYCCYCYYFYYYYYYYYSLYAGYLQLHT